MSTMTASQPTSGAQPAIPRPAPSVTVAVGPPVRLVPPPERELLDWPPSWEKIVVGADLDRESHELRSADWQLTDVAARIAPRSP